MKKKISFISLFIFLCFLFTPLVKAEEKIDLYFFYGSGCPHCAKERNFLNDMKKKYANIEIHEYETWNNSENNTLLTRVKNAIGCENHYVPYTVINGVGYTGYSENIAYQIENKIRYYDYHKEDIVQKVLENPKKYDVLQKTPLIQDHEENTKKNGKVEKKEHKKEEIIVLPIIGKVDAKSFSIPIMATVIGLVDGFNPCAMWILLFLISMLIGMKDHRKMWILGLTFLITSALIYLLFMVSWLNVAKLVSSISLVRNIIAVFALIAGCIHIFQYFKKNEDGCNIVEDKKRKKIFARIKKFTKEKNLLPALLGIMLLAVSVNIVELACSAGLPVLFTQVLAMNHLTPFEYGFYIFMYIFFFLLDDMIVFMIAMTTLKITGFSSKYGKYSHAIGGVIMLLIGLLLLLAPGILMFNF